MKKRFLSAALSAAMIVGCLPTTGLAAQAKVTSLKLLSPWNYSIYENTRGSIWETDDGSYFHYDFMGYMMPYLEFELGYSDGSKKIITENYFEDEQCIQCGFVDDQQNGIHFKAGETRMAYFEFMGARTEVPVKIKKNDVKNISFSQDSIDLYKLSDSFVQEIFVNGKAEEMNWYSILEKINGSLTIEYTNGSKKTVTLNRYTTASGDLYNDDGENYFMQCDELDATVHISMEAQDRNPWQPGKNYPLTISYGNASTVLQANIHDGTQYSPNPDSHFIITQARPVRLIANTGGSWKTDKTGNKYYEYEYDPAWDNELFGEITQNDTTYYFSGTTLPSEVNGTIAYDVKKQQAEEHWMPGNTYNIRLTFNGETSYYPVEIIKNDIASIDMIYENRPMVEEGKEGARYFNLDRVFQDFTFDFVLHKKNGSESVQNVSIIPFNNATTLMVNDKQQLIVFLDDNTMIRLSDVQEQTPWEPGSDKNLVTFSYAGCKTDVPVTVKENPIDSVTLVKPSSFRVIKNDPFTLYYEKLDKAYYLWNYYLLNDAVYKVKFKDGTTKNMNLQQMDAYGALEYDARFEDGTPAVGKNNRLYGYFYGIPFEIPVNFMERVPFTDVTSKDYFDKAVSFVYARKYMNGTSDTTFSPKSNFTRAQVVTMLWNMNGCPKADISKKSYPDVATDKYYSKAVAWAKENKIVSGRADGTFAPTANVSRQEMIVILYNYTKNFLVSSVDDYWGDPMASVKDPQTIASYAMTAMKWGVGNGIIGANGEVRANKPITRGESAVVVQRFMTRGSG